MPTRRSTVVLVLSLLVLALGLAGCPKQPLSPSATVPAPGSSSAGPPPRALGSRGGPVPAVSATPPAARRGPASPQAPPQPSEFKAIDALKDIHFDFDKYDIRPADAAILQADITWLRLHSDMLVLIEGHCDDRGTSDYNLSLGDRRAKATMTFLLAHGVRADRISTISYGEERPACTGHDETCWAQNRRAHFLVKER